ncbi:MAG: peptidoglycan-binding domain-containing protein [Rhodospirillales bacterium]|jgi:peptidoglycan hydrolase-like protein with peptidoglycan-binding domain|nr:hypothetical protein [Rhodospirillaceae bacterium]MDP6427632.1 peptidoglycan-binding domain-containing protein [Rhodospirillales bacterium]MDP6644818.1 peptidoglycan-binding domain-containing protein [Rhodospirillales bacterium]MDP6841397.1 peptidoglycan-binding domain-containing protein [Rhodospirillales bacterium]|tara:strand:- start:276 stop:590 length:315 start_codon:yes stop_codon:yes gene_type:complete
MTNHINLGGRVAEASSRGNRVTDTLKMKLGLERLGYFNEEAPVYIPGGDDGLWQGMRDFQKDHGLKVDGLADPGGPTVAAVNNNLKTAPAAEPLDVGCFVGLPL